MKYTTLLFFACISLASCTQNQKQETNSNNPADVPAQSPPAASVIEKKEPDEDEVKQRADSFMHVILDTNAVYWHWDEPEKNAPKSLLLFDTKGLSSVHAYSRKGYPQRSKPTAYKHFTLFLLEYQNKEHADSAFGQFAFAAENINADWVDSNDKNFEFLRRFPTKSGGFTGKKNNYILFLVESCGGGSEKYWKQQEKLFTDIVFDASDNGATLFNANCGMMKYAKETLKR